MSMVQQEETEKYIHTNRGKVNKDFFPLYHMTSPVGWMNDPNGLCRYNGRYHLYYQYNPYDVKPGTMIWGHFASDDLITYRDESVAILPERENASIFSGGAIPTEKGLCAVFTEHYEKGDFKRETVHAALSADGCSFGASRPVFDNEKLPANISRSDFRDPYPVYVDGNYYVFVGGKDVAADSGVIVVLGGKTLAELEYKFTIGPFYELGNMGECPCWHRVDGKDVIAVSGCEVKARGNDFKNVNSSVFIVGNLDFEGGKMKVDYISEIDKGDCFYAPQFINGEQRPILVGWHEMWGKPYPTKERGDGWVGSFTIPRRLSLKDGRLMQFPVEELDGYCREYDGNDVPRCSRLTLRFDGDGAVEIVGSDGSMEVACMDGYICLDTTRSNSGNGCVRRTNDRYAHCTVCVLLDKSSVEVFVDGGKEAISGRMYVSGRLSASVRGCAAVSKTEKVEV